jgi:hypothetical protein
LTPRARILYSFLVFSRSFDRVGYTLNQRFFLAALCCAVISGPAFAQNHSGTSAKAAGLTDSQKLEKSAENLERMKASLRNVLSKVEEARSEKDVVKLNCVNEKLTQVKGLIKVAEQADIALHEALTAKDPVADSEFTKIGIAKSKVDALKGDAEQCIGQLAYIVDEKTTVEVQAPQGLPGQDDDGEARREKDRHKRPGHHHHGPPIHKPRDASPHR